jgi:hypothetical protein
MLALAKMKMNAGIGLAVIAIAVGILAGSLVVTVEFSSAKTFLWLALIGAIAFGVGMTVLAYKKGKIPPSA